MRLILLSISFVGFLSFITTLFVLIMICANINGSKSSENQELFELSIIHISDFHARFDETNDKSLPCTQNDVGIGGYARIKTVVDYLRANRRNSIYLNAGDNFQGTFWYNLLRHNVTSYFLNLLPADAITLGNHEFAHRLSGLIPFLRDITSPVVVANIDDHLEKDFQNLYKKSIVIERSGRKIGIIGVIMQETAQVANTDKLIFTDEINAIDNECARLRQQGVNIIIVLSHCGLDRDKEIALETGEYVDVIVGGHSHTFLYTTKNNLYPASDIPTGPYPIIVTPKSGHDRKVLIVHAAAFAKYVGDLKVYFDAAGHIKYYDGNPIFLSNEIEKDPDIERELMPWRDEVNRRGQRIVGATNVNLMHRVCRHGECTLGSFAADAFVHETQIEFPDYKAYAAIIQAAGMRNSFSIGDIKYADIVAFMPFENTLDILDLSGDTIYEAFEHSVSRSFVTNEFIGIHMLQISGFHVTFNTTMAVGNRVQSLHIKITHAEYESVIPSKIYTLIVPSFIANGGDGFTMIKQKKKNHRIGLLDIDIMESYIARKSTVTHEIDGRIVMLT
jgi:5'-nucleotidase